MMPCVPVGSRGRPGFGGHRGTLAAASAARGALLAGLALALADLAGLTGLAGLAGFGVCGRDRNWSRSASTRRHVGRGQRQPQQSVHPVVAARAAAATAAGSWRAALAISPTAKGLSRWMFRWRRSAAAGCR